MRQFALFLRLLRRDVVDRRQNIANDSLHKSAGLAGDVVPEDVDDNRADDDDAGEREGAIDDCDEEVPQAERDAAEGFDDKSCRVAHVADGADAFAAAAESVVGAF